MWEGSSVVIVIMLIFFNDNSKLKYVFSYFSLAIILNPVLFSHSCC